MAKTDKGIKATVPAGSVPEATETHQYVTMEQFNKLTDIISNLATVVSAKTATPAEIKENSEISKAKSDQAPVPSSWEETARDIIGEALDHCELFQPRTGGTLFTVVIKNEFSNAPKEYLERMKADRRTKEIGNEGISGVETWCKLVRANLKRGQK